MTVHPEVELVGRKCGRIMELAINLWSVAYSVEALSYRRVTKDELAYSRPLYVLPAT